MEVRGMPLTDITRSRKQGEKVIRSATPMRLFIPALIVFCLIAVAGSAAWAREPSTSQVIQSRMDVLVSQGALQIDKVDVTAIGALPVFYERRNFEPMWTDPEGLEELSKMIAESADDGLIPEDYHAAEIAEMAGSTDYLSDPVRAADLDILCTDALVTLAYHLKFGKVDPERLFTAWNIYEDVGELTEVIERMEAVIEGRTAAAVARTIDEIRPELDIYRSLSKALVEYRRIEEEGGWPAVPGGDVLKEGADNQRVATLRKRLAVTGDLAPGQTDHGLFDEALVGGVEHFQKRHGLDVDGAVGPATLEALNVPVSEKIEMIRVNLERLRWVLQGDSPTFVVVNIAGFEVFYVKDEELVWRSRAQVGKEVRETPVFREDMKYLVFNPTWTVPPLLLKQDIIPKAAEDPAYLDRENIKVIDSEGRVIPAAEVDWKKYLGRGCPYTLRQDPGPNNALGRVKFIFPNEYFVYLHDTPSRSLFSRSRRTFSSGCIRVEYPLEFAEILLDDPERWNIDKIEDLIESAETKTVHLKQPLPVLLLYWTAFVDDGIINFREDIYGRDEPILAGLDGEFLARDRHINQRGR
jgi:murein L,D-transpeptidase YcbB/YkuD